MSKLLTLVVVGITLFAATDPALAEPVAANSQLDKAVSLLEVDDPIVSARGLAQLRELPESDIAPVLIHALNTPGMLRNAEVRSGAYKVLTSMSALDYAGGFEVLLHGISERGGTEFCAKALLGASKDQQELAVAELTRLLQSERAERSFVARIWLIGLIEDYREAGSSAFDALLEIAQNDQLPERDRREAGAAMVVVGGFDRTLSEYSSLDSVGQRGVLSGVYRFTTEPGDAHDWNPEIRARAWGFVYSQIASPNRYISTAAAQVAAQLPWEFSFIPTDTGFIVDPRLTEALQQAIRIYSGSDWETRLRRYQQDFRTNAHRMSEDK